MYRLHINLVRARDYTHTKWPNHKPVKHDLTDECHDIDNNTNMFYLHSGINVEYYLIVITYLCCFTVRLSELRFREVSSKFQSSVVPIIDKYFKINKF